MAVSALVFSSVAQATLIYSQDFESLNVGDLNGQAGFTAQTSVDVGNGGFGFTSGGLTVAGGSKSLLLNQATSGSNGNTASVPLGSSQSGQDLFFSFTWNKTSNSPDASADFLRFYLTNSATPTSTNDYLGVQLNGDALGVRVRNSSPALDSGFQPNPGAVSLTSGTTYFVAARATWNGSNYNSLRIWINPTTTLAAPTIASQFQNTGSATITTGISSISGLAIISGATGGNLDVGDIIRIDNIRVGSAFSDVALTAIPEHSSSAVLAGLGMLALSGVRRRRK